MPTISWGDLLLRLGLAAAAGAVVGIDRGYKGRPAGVRTMLLVCTGASLAMVLANWMVIHGGGPNSQAANDPSRFAQGILAGMGFLGAGTILKQGSTVVGVTTAASLWFVTILGLCFGAGCWAIGLVSWAIALIALFLLPSLEKHIHADRFAILTIVGRAEALDEQDLRRRLQAMGVRCVELCIEHQVAERLKTLKFDVKFHVNQQFTLPHQVVTELSHRTGILEVKWE